MRISDWSSDVCSSDLTGIALIAEDILQGQEIRDLKLGRVDDPDLPLVDAGEGDIVLHDVIDRATFLIVDGPLRQIEPGQTHAAGAVYGVELCQRRCDALQIAALDGADGPEVADRAERSEEHTSELQSLMR